MPAPGPTARTTLSLFQLLLRSSDATFSGRQLLRILHPADEFIPGQGCYALPSAQCRRIADESFAEIPWKLVHDATGDLLTAHPLEGTCATIPSIPACRS